VKRLLELLNEVDRAAVAAIDVDAIDPRALTELFRIHEEATGCTTLGEYLVWALEQPEAMFLQCGFRSKAEWIAMEGPAFIEEVMGHLTPPAGKPLH
jgi:hypothetical protein